MVAREACYNEYHQNVFMGIMEQHNSDDASGSVIHFVRSILVSKLYKIYELYKHKILMHPIFLINETLNWMQDQVASKILS